MLNEAAEGKEALDVNPLHKEGKIRQDKLEFIIIITTDNEDWQSPRLPASKQRNNISYQSLA